MKKLLILMVTFLCVVSISAQHEGLKSIPKKEATALEKFKAKFNKGKSALGDHIMQVLTTEDMPPSPETNNQESFRIGFLETGMDGSKGLIVFDLGKANLTLESKRVLDKLAIMIISLNNEIELNIGGHTDNTGSEELNLKLSDKRAKVVKDYLIIKGVPSNFIKTIGYGESKPKYSNDNSITRAMNRRVEFDFYEVN